jgi:hypothetical protein
VESPECHYRRGAGLEYCCCREQLLAPLSEGSTAGLKIRARAHTEVACVAADGRNEGAKGGDLLYVLEFGMWAELGWMG